MQSRDSSRPYPALDSSSLPPKIKDAITASFLQPLQRLIFYDNETYDRGDHPFS